ncbi:hypothetical protein [Microbacterium suwonense]|uniref:hypothetical protein n=1 Tax=Microbacterium suwonense TaxID=683047 RepID=UPI0025736DAB|nr:hypothetical protein [Microbacterium suwonense]
MEWDHLFEDLEGQLAAEWDAERAALDAESERLRIAKLTMRDRLLIMAAGSARLSLELSNGERWDCRMRVIGADWIGVCAHSDPRLRVVPLSAVAAIAVDHGTLLGSLEQTVAPAADGNTLRERMTLGFVLRDLARRRTTVTLARHGADPQHGTIDRAGADHLDLALHEAGEPRRARSVRGFQLIPFDTVCWVRLDSGGSAAA